MFQTTKETIVNILRTWLCVLRRQAEG